MHFPEDITLSNGRPVGPGHPCLVVAEIGNNHDGSFEQACRMIAAAAEAGADAVKFQTFKADKLVSPAPVAPGSLWKGRNQRSWQDVFKDWELPREWHLKLSDHAASRGVLFFSTAFDLESVDFLESVGVPFHKIASFEITYPELLEKVASTGKPIILSTGASYLREVEDAMSVLRRAGADEVVLLHCGSCYPLAVEDVNLRAMQTLSRVFTCPVGYSDHTPGMEAALGAVSLGACVIEKHFTLDRSLPGPDHAVSMEPGGFSAMVRSIRAVESALGSFRKEPVAAEAGARSEGRRSLHAARDIPAGSVLMEGDIVVVRPAAGIGPNDKHCVIGSQVRTNLIGGQPVMWNDLE